MRRLLITIFLATCSLSLVSAESCKVEAITLRSRVEAQPGFVLYALGDSIALYPRCMPELVEAAIEAANPDDDTLTQIIKLAVSEYPEESGAIAEAAVMAAPDRVDVIRNAFIPTRKAIVATPVLDEPQSSSPIENFLTNYRPPAEPIVAVPVVPEVNLLQGDIEVKTSKPLDPEDVATNALKAIDDLLAKLKNQDGCLVSAENSEIKTSMEPKTIETFRLNLTNSLIAISTIDDHSHFDTTDENLENPDNKPLLFQDPVANTDLAEYFRNELIEKEEIVPADETEEVEFTSSVYFIPSSADLMKNGQRMIAPHTIRSTTVSPTLPRGR